MILDVSVPPLFHKGRTQRYDMYISLPSYASLLTFLYFLIRIEPGQPLVQQQGGYGTPPGAPVSYGAPNPGPQGMPPNRMF